MKKKIKIAKWNLFSLVCFYFLYEYNWSLDLKIAIFIKRLTVQLYEQSW